MYLIRFLDYLDKWKNARSIRKLPSVAINDCLSKDGDLSFFLIPVFSNNYLSDDILKIVCRYAFSNISKWEDSTRDNGAVFLLRKKVERIKKVDEDPPGALGTVHCNMPDVLTKQTDKLRKLIFKNRKISFYYRLESIETVIISLSDSDWDSLFSIIKKDADKMLFAGRIKNYFFRGKHRPVPRQLLKYTQIN